MNMVYTRRPRGSGAASFVLGVTGTIRLNLGSDFRATQDCDFAVTVTNLPLCLRLKGGVPHATVLSLRLSVPFSKKCLLPSSFAGGADGALCVCLWQAKRMPILLALPEDLFSS